MTRRIKSSATIEQQINATFRLQTSLYIACLVLGLLGLAALVVAATGVLPISIWWSGGLFVAALLALVSGDLPRDRRQQLYKLQREGDQAGRLLAL